VIGQRHQVTTTRALAPVQVGASGSEGLGFLPAREEEGRSGSFSEKKKGNLTSARQAPAVREKGYFRRERKDSDREAVEARKRRKRLKTGPPGLLSRPPATAEGTVQISTLEKRKKEVPRYLGEGKKDWDLLQSRVAPTAKSDGVYYLAGREKGEEKKA